MQRSNAKTIRLKCPEGLFRLLRRTKSWSYITTFIHHAVIGEKRDHSAQLRKSKQRPDHPSTTWNVWKCQNWLRLLILNLISADQIANFFTNRVKFRHVYSKQWCGVNEFKMIFSEFIILQRQIIYFELNSCFNEKTKCIPWLRFEPALSCLVDVCTYMDRCRQKQSTPFVYSFEPRRSMYITWLTIIDAPLLERYEGKSRG